MSDGTPSAELILAVCPTGRGLSGTSLDPKNCFRSFKGTAACSVREIDLAGDCRTTSGLVDDASKSEIWLFSRLLSSDTLGGRESTVSNSSSRDWDGARSYQMMIGVSSDKVRNATESLCQLTSPSAMRCSCAMSMLSSCVSIIYLLHKTVKC